jgi:hypothetical protein
MKGGNKECMQRFGRKISREETTWKNKHACISEDNIKMYMRDISCKGVDWTKPIHAGYSGETV